MLDELTQTFYVILICAVSLYGFHALVLTFLYMINRNHKAPGRRATDEWPIVAVQIPLYNEQAVAERIIDTAAAFDYPLNRLIIQVLDDSTDQTTEMARQKVLYYQAQGYQIEMLHRENREGYKAGALQAGLERLDADYIAVFDADFLPDRDYLKQIIPYFTGHPRLGMVQARWGHLNRNNNLLTRAQALFLDGHHVVEQMGRSRSGLLMNFNGTCGVWRAECIRDAGGWHFDTLSEDIDLSLRAQMNGWELTFLPDLIVPGEIPPNVTFFKRQQYRWNFGYAQVMKKYTRKLWTTPGLSFFQRLFGTFQLSANLTHLAGCLIFLISLPLVMFPPRLPSSLGIISLVSTGPTILVAISQLFGYHDNPLRRLSRVLYLPVLLMLTVGTAFTNGRGVLMALIGRKGVFTRTPKFNLSARSNSTVIVSAGNTIDPDVWIEIGIAIYQAVCLSLAIQHGVHEMVPLTALGMLSYGFVGFSGLVENSRPSKSHQIEVEMAGH